MEYKEKPVLQSFKRYCKTLQLRNDPELIQEYCRVHEETNVWPEIGQGMKEVGIIDMEIYLTGTTLFMIMDTLEDFNHESAMKVLSDKPRQKEWEQFVARFQRSDELATADQKWQLIERIYKL